MECALCAHNVQVKYLGLHTLIDCDECKLRYLITDVAKKFYFEGSKATPDNNQMLLSLLKRRYSENDYAKEKEAIWVCFSDSPICRMNDALIIKDIISFRIQNSR